MSELRERTWFFDRVRSSRRVFYITLHGLGEPRNAIPPEERRYWLTVNQFQHLLDTVEGLPDVRITFDDGNDSDALIALPALVERRMSARFFVTTNRLNSRGFLSNSQVAELMANGMQIGQHGLLHRPWRGLGMENLKVEINDSRKVLEEVTGASVEEAAIPYGEYDRTVLRALKEAGYRRVFTSDGGWSTTAEWRVPRNTIYANTAGDLTRLMVASTRPLFRVDRCVRATIKRLR